MSKPASFQLTFDIQTPQAATEITSRQSHPVNSINSSSYFQSGQSYKKCWKTIRSLSGFNPCFLVWYVVLIIYESTDLHLLCKINIQNVKMPKWSDRHVRLTFKAKERTWVSRPDGMHFMITWEINWPFPTPSFYNPILLFRSGGSNLKRTCPLKWVQSRMTTK